MKKDFVRMEQLAIVILLILISISFANAKLKPNFIKDEILRTEYDGVSNDLLTGGLGKTGLQGAQPTFSDPFNPTKEELRTLAIYSNYRALVDMTPGGGYSRLYGPNVTADGQITENEGLIAGVEYIAYIGNHSGHKNVTVMVQIPNIFNPENPCIVTAPSSGSRGVYGAIATAGEWGLKQGCTVTYVDKGTGMGVHDLQNDTVNLITGEREDADTAKKDSNFTSKINKKQLADFNVRTPNRFAFKHAHSQQNPEKDWGKHVLQSIEFAFYVLNKEFPDVAIIPENTIVIASSISNGGGASIKAAEQDRKGLIDGVTVAEPNVNPRPGGNFIIKQGENSPFTDHSMPLFDYTSLVNIYQGCASLASENSAAPFNLVSPQLGEDRCDALYRKGLLQSESLLDQAEEAQDIINNIGILPEQNLVQPSHFWLFVPQAIAVTYANSYGRFSVIENLCGYSFGGTSTEGHPEALSEEIIATLFGIANGIPPTGGVNLINNLSVGGPREDRVSISASTGLNDQNFDGALCLRRLATGVDETEQRLVGKERRNHMKIKKGISKIFASGNLHGLPAVIVTGRSDAILPPNHTSRAYFGLNKLVEGQSSNLRYYEVVNAQHLDALNALPGFNSLFIPLHYYFIQSMNLMFYHLHNSTPLPPSQVVKTTPRGSNNGTVQDISIENNLPPIAADSEYKIIFSQNIVSIPE